MLYIFLAIIAYPVSKLAAAACVYALRAHRMRKHLAQRVQRPASMGRNTSTDTYTTRAPLRVTK